MSAVIINASTSLVQALPSNVVILSTLNYPGQIITVRDYSGQCSTGSVITISTALGVQFLNGIPPNSNFFQISQPYGFLTFTSKSSNIWAVVNSFAFQDQSVASIDNLNAPFINTSSVYANVLSTTYLFPSTIGLNCNAPRFLLDANGIINVKELYQDGRLFIPDGNLSTVNSSTINIRILLNLSNTTPVDPPALRVQDTVIYGGTPSGPVAGSNQIFLTSNLINLDNTAFLTATHQLGVNLSTTSQSVDVSGNVQADAFLLRSSIVTIPATIQQPTPSSIKMAAFANDRWFLSEDSADATNKTFFSLTDGYTWSTLTNLAGFSRNSIAYGNGRYVIGGSRSDSTSNALAFSLDGITWTAAASNAFGVVNSVVFMTSLSRFIAVGSNVASGQSFATSPDGITWTFFGPTGKLYNEVIVDSATSITLVGESKVLDFAFTTNSGVSWGVFAYGTTIPFSFNIKTAQVVSNLIYLGGFTDGTSNNTLIRGPLSYQGPWTSLTTPLTSVNKLRFFSSIFVATGQRSISPQSNSAIITSSDGLTWTARSNPLIGVGRDIGYFNGQWIVGGATSSASPTTGGIVASLDNGITWNQTVLADFFSSSKITVSSSYLFLNDINLTEQYTSNTSFYSTINSLQSGSRSTVAGLGSSGYLSTVLSTFSNLFTSTINATNPANTIRVLANLSVANSNTGVPDIQLPGLAIRQSYSATNPTNYMQTASDRLNINNTVWITNTTSATSGRVGIGREPTAGIFLDVAGTANFNSTTIISSLLVNTTTLNPAYVVNANGPINATSYLRNGVEPIFPNPLSSVVMSTLLVNSSIGFALSNTGSTLLGGLLSSLGGANFGDSLNAASYLRAGVPIPRAYSTFQLSTLSLNTPTAAALVITGSTIVNGLISTNGNIQTSGSINAGNFLVNGNPFAPDTVSSITLSSIRSIVDPLAPINITTFVNSTNPNTSNVWFAGVSNAGGVVGRYSTDNGATWLVSAFPGIATNTVITASAWNGRYFLCAASPATLTTNSVTFYSSINGVSWSAISATGTFPRTRVNKIVWTGTQWMVGGQFTQSSTEASNATIARSADGGTWTGCTSGGFSAGTLTAGECQDIGFNGYTLVALGNNTNPNHGGKYSTDGGANWLPINSMNPFGLCIATNGRMFVSGGYNNPNMYSFDGITWSNATGVPFGPGQITNSIATNGRIFVCQNFTNIGSINQFYYSFDGINWTGGTTVSAYAASITWNGSRFIAGSPQQFIIYTSADGITWTSSTPNTGSSGTNIPSISFTSNVNPDFQIENLSIYGKNQWPVVRSTNTIHLGPSTMIFNSMFRLGFDGRVGINCNSPQNTLDVNGTLYASTIVAGSITGFVTDANLTSTVRGLGSSGYVSTATLTSSLTGLGSLGYISTSGLTFSFVSTVGGLSASGYVSTQTLNSSLTGLGTLAYVSTASLTSTVANITTNFSTAAASISSIISRVTPTTPIEMNAFLDVMNQRTSNIWVAAGVSAGGCMRYSLDGSNWLNTNVTADNSQDVAWNGNYFLSVTYAPGGGSLQYISSVNGATWGAIPISGQRPDTFPQTIIWTGSQWLLGGTVNFATSSNSTITRSVDGATWVGATSGGFATACHGIATNGRRIVAVGKGATAADNIKYSDDNGATWTNGTGGTFSDRGWGVATDGRNWICVGADTNSNALIKYSIDGISWSNVSTANNLTGTAYGIKYNGILWVASGANSGGAGDNMIYSQDGRLWQKAGPPASGSCTAGKIAWSGTRWAVGTNDSSAGNRIRTSADGINWSVSATANMFNNQANAVAFTSNVFPDFQVENLSFYGKAQWPALTSTNAIYISRSNININTVANFDGQNSRVDILTQQRIIAQGSTSLSAYGNNGAPETLMLLSPTNAYRGAVASIYFGLNEPNYPLARIVAREVPNVAFNAAYQSELLFQTNNLGNNLATRMLIDRNGRVGVNTTDPQFQFHVNNTSGNSGILVTMAQSVQDAMIRLSNASGAGVTFAIPQGSGQWNTGAASNDFIIRTENAAQRIFMNSGANNTGLCISNGSVGIGTNAPQQPLDVNNVIRCYNDANDVMGLFATTYGNYLHIGAWDRTGTTSKNMVLNQFGGNVAIGTTAANNTLTVKGVVQVTDGGSDQKYAFYSDGNVFQLNPRNSSGGFNSIAGFAMASNGRVSITTPLGITSLTDAIMPAQLTLFAQGVAQQLKFATYYTSGSGQGSYIQSSEVFNNVDNVTPLFLNPKGGNIGINTTAPGEALGISGVLNLLGGTVQTADPNVDAANKTNTYIRFGPAGAGSDWAYLRQIGGDNRIHIALDFHDDFDDGNFSIRRVQSTANPDAITTLFTVTNSGDVTASGNVTASSDSRLKKDILPICNALSSIQELRGVYFTKIDTNIKSIGLIAQEVEPVIPEVVHTEKSEQAYKSVAYPNLVAILIEAVKELSSKVNILENKLKDLSNE
jgi:hypothetical protein